MNRLPTEDLFTPGLLGPAGRTSLNPMNKHEFAELVIWAGGCYLWLAALLAVPALLAPWGWLRLCSGTLCVIALTAGNLLSFFGRRAKVE